MEWELWRCRDTVWADTDGWGCGYYWSGKPSLGLDTVLNEQDIVSYQIIFSREMRFVFIEVCYFGILKEPF